MKQKDITAAEIGLGSITSILQSIHDEQLTIGSVIKNIRESIVDGLSNVSVSTVLGNINSLNLPGINKTLNSIDYGVQSILSRVTEYFDSRISSSKNVSVGGSNNNELTQKLGNMVSNYMNSSLLTDNMIQILSDNRVLMVHTNALLSDILSFVSDIYVSIKNKSGNGDNVTTSVKTRNEEFNKLLESFTELEKKLSDRFIKNFNEFVKFYTTFIDEKNSKKLRITSVGLNMFAAALKGVSILMTGVKSTFNGLSSSIIFLTLSVINPLFTLAITTLVGTIKGLKRVFGDLKTAMLMPRTMTSIALAIATFVGSLFLVQKLSFATLGKFLLFITGLLGVLRLFGGGANAEVPSLSDAFAGKKTVIKNKSSVTGIFSAALGVAILVLALDSAKSIDYSKAGMLLMFLTGLSTTMLLIRKTNKNSGANDFLKISGGLTILVLAVAAVGEVNWLAALGMISGFILGISAVIMIANKMMGSGSGLTGKGGLNMMFNGNVSMKGMFGFAMGLAILLLVVDAIQEVNWKSTVILLGFISAVSLAVAFPGLISKGKMNGQPVGGMFGFSVGIAILLLTVDACSEVNWSNAWKLVLFLGALVLEFKLLQAGIKSGKDLMLSVGAIVLATTGIIGVLKLLDFITVDYGKLIFFGLASLEFLTIMGTIGFFQKQIHSGSKALLSLVGGMFMISGLIWWILGYVTIDIQKMIDFATGVSIIIGLSILASTFDSQIKKGAVGLLIISGTGILLAYAFKQIADINIQITPFLYFMGAVTVLTLGMVAASFVAVPAAIGAAAVLVVAVTSFMIAVALKTIETVNITEPKIKQFGDSIVSLIDSYNQMGLVSTGKAVIKAGMLIVISGSSLLASVALRAISVLNISELKIKQFGASIVSLIDSYNQMGLVSTGKAVIKAGMLVPIATVSLLVAGMFKLISAMEIKPNTMSNFGILLNDFLTTTVELINKSKDLLKSIKPGIESIAKLVSVGKGLLDIVETYANMKIGEWRYNSKTGKMELTGYRKINDKLFTSVGTNIGKLLSALIQPLTVISTNDDTWNFNGVKVKNPFKRGWFGDNNSGVNRITKIGNAFNSFVGIMRQLTGNQMLNGNWKDYLRFRGIFDNFIVLMVNSIHRFKAVNSESFGNHGKNIGEFFEHINKISATDDKRSMASQVRDLMNELSDKVKWNIINNQLSRTQKNIDSIAKSINKISIQKATMLQKNLQLLSDAKTSYQLQRCVSELENLISTIVEYQDKQQQTNERLTTTIGQAFGVSEKKEAEQNGIVYDKEGNIDRNKTDIKALLTQIIFAINELRITADKQTDMDVYVTNLQELKSILK